MTTTTTEKQSKFAKPGELAAEWELSLSSITRWINDGVIPCQRIGHRTVRILRKDVQPLLDRESVNFRGQTDLQFKQPLTAAWAGRLGTTAERCPPVLD